MVVVPLGKAEDALLLQGPDIVMVIGREAEIMHQMPTTTADSLLIRPVTTARGLASRCRREDRGGWVMIPISSSPSV